MKSKELRALLTQMVQSHKAFANTVLHADTALLNKKNNAESWSALECLQHLNLYGKFYIAEIKKATENTAHNADENFNPGLLGNYFANAMLPKNKLNKMKTFKNMNPLNSRLDAGVIGVFIAQQNEMLALLEAAEKQNLNKIRIPITLTKFIKLKLGDTFRFVINHNERHIQQAKRAMDLS